MIYWKKIVPLILLTIAGPVVGCQAWNERKVPTRMATAVVVGNGVGIEPAVDGVSVPPSPTSPQLVTNTPLPPTATPTAPPSNSTPIPLPPTATPEPLPPSNTPLPTAVPGSPGVGPVYLDAVLPVTVLEDIVYGQGLRRGSWTEEGGIVVDLTLDIYMPPTGNSLRPSILLFHGGGFQGGGSDYPNMVVTAEYFASRGWVVFVANYRLEEDYGSVPQDWPQEPGYLVYPAGRDAKAAVRWVHANAEQYQLSPYHMTAMGGSAGGMMALMLGVSVSRSKGQIARGVEPTL